MNLNNKTLDQWLAEQPKKDFPYDGKVDYFNRYKAVKEYLDNNIHPHILSATSNLEPDENIYLTDHGTGHIDTVIKRISNLINVEGFDITPYEAYLLLVATQLHDTGHIKSGRVNHEKFSSQVIADLSKLVGEETVEKRMIWQIAEAHGGRKPDGEKDKIDGLLPQTALLNFPIRPQLLAALLRFSDELADDFTRTNHYIIQNGTIEKPSEIFHYYASVLNSVEIDHIAHEIRINFTLEKEHIIKKFGKPCKECPNGYKEVYLVDEIFERIFKMYVECIYCMRFISTHLKIETIIAKIEFIERTSLLEFRKPLSIKITQRGYPKMLAVNVYDLCGDDLIENGSQITGEYLKQLLN